MGMSTVTYNLIELSNSTVFLTHRIAAYVCIVALYLCLAEGSTTCPKILGAKKI